MLFPGILLPPSKYKLKSFAQPGIRSFTLFLSFFFASCDFELTSDDPQDAIN